MPPSFYDLVARRRTARTVIVRLYPLLAAVSLWRIERTSTLDPRLLFLSGRVSTVALYFYAVLLVIAAAAPRQRATIHAVGAALAVLVIGGRLIAFIGIYFDGRPDLEGTVWERAWLLMSMLIWHWSVSIYGATEYAKR